MTRYAFPARHTAILSVAMTLLSASIAAAQTPPASPTAAPQTGLVWSVDFAQRVTGRHLIITTSDGRLYEGVVSVTPTSLATTGSKANATVPFGQIARIEKPTYRVRKGTFLGMLAGATLGMVLVCTAETHCGEDALLAAIAWGGLGAGAGASIGVVLNHAHRQDDILYDSNRRTTTVAMAPMLSPTRKGIAVRMTWR